MFGSAARVTLLDRRRILHLATATLAFTVAAACGDNARHRIRLGSGLAGGLFHEFGNTLAAAAERSPTVRITPVPTAGSVKNLELLESGAVDAALTLADTAAATNSRGLAVGRLYESYIHLAVHVDSPVRHIGDLRGTRVDVGVAGSGAANNRRCLDDAIGWPRLAGNGHRVTQWADARSVQPLVMQSGAVLLANSSHARSPIHARQNRGPGTHSVIRSAVVVIGLPRGTTRITEQRAHPGSRRR
ncbi:TAXI family TRAP transporter solute-binding subunit [Nocardia fusca]|uniref:TAXI family TRAP transporter solute-binding subunit n=1 Tax=Nocardia fusca TaxID=941183 RepID=UPI0007A747E2